MDFEWTVKFGDILTSITILVSVAALVISWSKYRLTRETEQADRVRSAAARSLTKLDRWQLLSLSLYDELQPFFVETSEMLSTEFNVIKARDHLWKETNRARMSISSKILEEEIATSYVDLIAHFPIVREKIRHAINTLDELERQTSDKYLEASQKDVFSMHGKENSYHSAMLGDALRNTAFNYRKQLLNETDKVIEPIRELLFSIIVKPNREILGPGRELTIS